MKLWLRSITFAGVFSAVCVAHAANPTALSKRLHDASDTTSLDSPTLKPWHLKLAIQLYDAKGNPSEQGTLEEWWTPDASKRVYATPSYAATEIYSHSAVYRTKGQPMVPYFLDAAFRLVTHPMISTEIIDQSNPAMQVQSFGKAKLDCIMLSKNPIGRVPSFCFDEGGDQLRLSWLDPQVMTRNSIGLFQGVKVGVDTSVSIYGLKAVTQHIEVLSTTSLDASFFIPGSDLEDRSNDPVWVRADAATTMILHKIPPIYPDEAKSKHISGAVMLIVTIGEDGHVVDTAILGNPEPSLTKSAITAVKQWTYAPYLINGAAVKRRTTVAVHYNFGG